MIIFLFPYYFFFDKATNVCMHFLLGWRELLLRKVLLKIVSELFKTHKHLRVEGRSKNNYY